MNGVCVLLLQGNNTNALPQYSDKALCRAVLTLAQESNPCCELSSHMLTLVEGLERKKTLTEHESPAGQGCG
jgi:hypothetical protein